MSKSSENRVQTAPGVQTAPVKLATANGKPRVDSTMNNHAVTAAPRSYPFKGLKKLTDRERTRLRQEDACFRCRKVGHRARGCPWNHVPSPYLERPFAEYGPFPFLALPVEIRLLVYSHLFGERKIDFGFGYVMKLVRDMFPPPAPDTPSEWRYGFLHKPIPYDLASKKAILLVSRQIHAEALPVLHEKTIFNFDINNSPTHTHRHNFDDSLKRYNIVDVAAGYPVKMINVRMYHCYCEPVRGSAHLVSEIELVLSAILQHGVQRIGLQFEPNFAIPRVQRAVVEALKSLEHRYSFLIKITSGNHRKEVPGADAEHRAKILVDGFRQNGHTARAVFSKNMYLGRKRRE